MKVCHCIMPTINPLACKNCNNNTDEYDENKVYSFEPLVIEHFDYTKLSKEDFKKLTEDLLTKAYPKSIPNDDVK